MTTHPVPERSTDPRVPPVASSRIATSTLFAAALLAFLLPFGTVSCGTPVTFTGLELATGSVTGDDPEVVAAANDTGTLPALVAAVCACGGLLLALAGARGPGTSALVGLLPLLLLPWLTGLAEFEVHEGFVLAVAAFASVVAWRSRLLIVRRKAVRLRVWPAVSGLVLLVLVGGLTAAYCIAASASFGTA
jgi:hypothetical protein